MTLPVPKQDELIVDRQGRMSPYWRRFFQSLHSGEVTLTQNITELGDTIQNNPPVHLGTVIGLDGIVVTGDLSTQLVIRFPGGGGAGLALSDTAPENTTSTPFWVDTSDGTFYIWYDDGTSAQWVAFGSAGGSGGAEGVPYQVADGDTYNVPAGQQALFSMPIELLGDASLDVSGYLIEVT